MDLPRTRPRSPGRLAFTAAAVALAVGASSVVVGWIEATAGIPDASSLYLVGVAAVAIAVGTAGAALTALVSVIVYDLLYTEPRFMLTVSDPEEWLTLLLLLFVAVTVGQLAALQRVRAESAEARERESRALFEVTRALASCETTTDALPAIGATVARAARMDRVWFALGGDDAEERLAGGYPPDDPPRPGGAFAILHRGAGPVPSRWTLVRGTTPGRGRARRGARLIRVRLEEGGRSVGSLWAEREVDDGTPDATETALLLVTADLVTQSLAHDRLVEERHRTEVAQQSDALKSALLESVSHDLRTPLASIRASAGTLMDAEVDLDAAEIRASAAAIDLEAQRLNRIVGDLLDLSRIEGGALRVAHDILDVEDVVTRAVAQVAPRSEGRTIEAHVDGQVTALADPVLLEQVLINLLENAVRHTPPDARVLVEAVAGPDTVRISVHDSGPGVPDDVLPHIFDKFFRVRGKVRPSSGSGVGLAVVRGFTEAMDGAVTARTGSLGGLEVAVELPAAQVPIDVEVGV